MTTPTYLTVKQTAAAMRAELKETLPGTAISVRMSVGTAHGWVSVTWEDGPTVAQVEEVLAPFQSSFFDGMDDAYKAIEQSGTTRYSCRGVTSNRQMSTRAAHTIADVINAQTKGGPARVEGASVLGVALSEQQGQRLDVHGVGTPGEVDMDLAAHQIFSRTTFTTT